jgi:hypothetical protein
MVCLQCRFLFLSPRMRLHPLQDMYPHRPLELLDRLLYRLRLLEQTT